MIIIRKILYIIIFSVFLLFSSNIYAEEFTNIKYNSYINDNSVYIEENFIKLKNSNDYTKDISFKYAVDSYFNEYNNFKEKYKNFTENIENSISVRKLLIDSKSPLLEEYDKKISEDVTISLYNLKDIIYYNDETNSEETLITSSELQELINKTYFLDYYNKFNEFYLEFEYFFNEYKTYYKKVFEDYNNAINRINEHIKDIENFINQEKNNNRKLNLQYENENIIKILNIYIKNLEETLSNILSSNYNNDFEIILSKANFLKEYFFNNNKILDTSDSKEKKSLVNSNKKVNKFTNIRSAKTIQVIKCSNNKGDFISQSTTPNKKVIKKKNQYQKNNLYDKENKKMEKNKNK